MTFVRFVHDQAKTLDVAANFFERRPVGSLVVRQPAADGINAEGKQPVKLRVKGRDAKSVASNQVSVKRLEVTEIEKNAMTLGDGPVVNCFRPDQAE